MLPTTAFISYAQSTRAYEKQMIVFANHLRRVGIDAKIDLYYRTPRGGWPRWMEEQIRTSDYVIVVCDEVFYEKFYKTHSRGVTWEVRIIYQMLYHGNVDESKFIPAIWKDGDEQYIPLPLQGNSYYVISDDDGFDSLLRHLHGMSKYEMPELGNYTPLSPKRQQISFARPELYGTVKGIKIIGGSRYRIDKRDFRRR